MLLAASRLLGSTLLKWKRRRDRRYVGIYLGPPPKLICAAELEIGDVLFCAGGKKKITRAIRAISTDEYSHCALYVGGGAVVEVVTSGIQRATFDQLLSQYDYVSVTRCPGTKGNKQRQRRIQSFARKSLGGRVSGYSYKDAALAPFRELSDLRNLHRLWAKNIPTITSSSKNPKRMFCVQFIIEAFMFCGYIRSDDPYTQPIRRTPTGLAEENIFEHVGYSSSRGWAGVSQDDLYLAGNSWVITDDGRAQLQQQQDEMQNSIRKHCIPHSELYRHSF